MTRMLVAVLLVGLALASAALAGFAGRPVARDPPALPTLAEGVHEFEGLHWPPIQAHDATGQRVDAHPLLAQPPWAVQQLLPQGGAEPSVGVARDGTLFVVTFDHVQRSTDHGRTWEVVHSFETTGHPTTTDAWASPDPMFWLDPTTDRLFAGHLYPDFSCLYLGWSDDRGDTWTERLLSCDLPYLLDNPRIATGPYPAGSPLGPPLARYPNVLYVCTNRPGGAWCQTSLDGGETLTPARLALALPNGCTTSRPVAFPDGTVALVQGGAACRRTPTVALSADLGTTWTVRTHPGDQLQVESQPALAVTPDGTAYLVYRHADHQVYVLRSPDRFETWNGPYRASPPGHTLNAFTAVTGGDDGRIAIAYFGTRSEQREGAEPGTALGGTLWHLFLSTSHDAASDAPTFATQQVTADEDPVQVGCIWLRAGGGPHNCGNLRHFVSLTHDPDGRTVAAFGDGCTPRYACTGDTDAAAFWSQDRQPSVAVQDRGPSLYAARGLLPALGLEPPRPFP